MLSKVFIAALGFTAAANAIAIPQEDDVPSDVEAPFPEVNSTTPVVGPTGSPDLTTTTTTTLGNATTTTTVATPAPTGVRDGVPADSVCTNGQRYTSEGELFVEACDVTVTGTVLIVTAADSFNECANACANVNAGLDATCAGWVADADTFECTLFSDVEQVVLQPGQQITKRQAAGDVITIPGDRAGFPADNLPPFVSVDEPTTPVVTVTPTLITTVTDLVTITSCVDDRCTVKTVAPYPTSYPVTKTVLVPCPTGWEEKVTTVYVGHCGCAETPIPTAPASSKVITTVCPSTWDVPGGPTVTLTVPVDGPKGPVVTLPATADSHKPVTADSHKPVTADADKPVTVVGDKVYPTADAGTKVGAGPTATAPKPTSPVVYDGAATTIAGSVAGVFAILAAAIML